ncbi:hypothetical protein [Flavobacterium sp.]|jgi:hypothetical protein|uniref:hypothetical protein n=1 Tax=Flavobacterium sp. TaxID=239 RepID=UPI0038D179E5
MKKLFYLFFFYITLTGNSQAQDLVPLAQDSIAIKADNYFGFDGYQNYYFSSNDIVIKKNKLATLQFQDLSLGEVTKVDVLNPLKIIVFYEKFNTVVILDNQMNETERINFSERDFSIVVSAVGVADQNKLWIFNSLNQKLALYDLITKNIQEIGNSLENEIANYQTDYNYFQWISKSGQWNSCDRYGSVRNITKLELPEKIQIIAPNTIVYLKENTLFVGDFEIGKKNKIKIVEKTFRNFYYKDQILSIFTNEGITNYKINLP